jgi:hypothetical protein
LWKKVPLATLEDPNETAGENSALLSEVLDHGILAHQGRKKEKGSVHLRREIRFLNIGHVQMHLPFLSASSSKDEIIQISQSIPQEN